MTGFGQGPVTTTQGAPSTNQIPISQVAVPGHSGGDLTALEGGPESTDANSNKTAPASVYTYDGKNVTLGAKADAAITNASSTGTQIAFVKGIVKVLADVWDSVMHRLNVQQNDVTITGTISAAQPGINTPVTSATLALQLGQGQSTWKAILSNGGGGFTSGTTLDADKSPDGGTTWFPSSFKVNGASPDTPASSVVGPGPLSLTGNCAGATHVRIRCSVLNSTETIAVTLDASVGVAEVSVLAPLPAGPNTIGGVTITNFPSSLPITATSLPLPTGAATEAGHLAAIDTVQGLTSDAAVVGDTAGTQSAKLRGINKLLAAFGLDNTDRQKVSLYVKLAAAADTLLTLGQTTKANSLSVALASDQATTANPILTNDQIRALIAAGQGYRATTGVLSTGASNAFIGVQAIANALAKTCVIYNAYISPANVSGDLRLYAATNNTADTNLTGTMTSGNQQPGGTASTLALSCSPAATTQTTGFVGTQTMSLGSAANVNINILQNGSQIYLKNGVAANTSIYAKIPTSGNSCAITIEWIEF